MLMEPQWRVYLMIKNKEKDSSIVNWIDVINEKLLIIGVSLKTDISILGKHKIEFNEIIRDLLDDHPNSLLNNIIMSMKEYYEVEELYSILDEQNKSILLRHASEYYNIPLVKKSNKRSSKKR